MGTVASGSPRDDRILRQEGNGDVFAIHPWEPDSDQESSDMDEDSDSDEPDTGIMYQ